MTDKKQITAAMLIIGNEVLSGRTQDKTSPLSAMRWARLALI